MLSEVPVTQRPPAAVELCEHKGIGHPDTICDGVAEAVSQALCRAYLRAYGAIQHYNVDKALLIAGRSAPRLGGGRVLEPIRLIVAGRASPLPDAEAEEIVENAARAYLRDSLHCNPSHFAVTSATRAASANLRRIFPPRATAWRANDTSFGAAYAPYSLLNRSVLKLAEVLRSTAFRERFPAAGEDYKIMGARVDEEYTFTVALAFIDRYVTSLPHYFATRAAIVQYLRDSMEPAVPSSFELVLNALDDPAARDESGIYLTVTGLSAEQGDDGEVGRGNRLSGLITPTRIMSLEAAAGKNPVAHVGKLYNALALEMARNIHARVPGVAEVSVQILSTIGDPVAQPRLVAVDIISQADFGPAGRREAEEVARGCLMRVDELTGRLIRGEIAVF